MALCAELCQVCRISIPMHKRTPKTHMQDMCMSWPHTRWERPHRHTHLATRMNGHHCANNIGICSTEAIASTAQPANVVTAWLTDAKKHQRAVHNLCPHTPSDLIRQTCTQSTGGTVWPGRCWLSCQETPKLYDSRIQKTDSDNSHGQSHYYNLR